MHWILYIQLSQLRNICAHWIFFIHRRQHRFYIKRRFLRVKRKFGTYKGSKVTGLGTKDNYEIQQLRISPLSDVARIRPCLACREH